MDDVEKIQGILDENKHKNFVQRILEPDKFPHINLPNGQIATHMMAWTEADGKYFVYPTISYDGRKLIDYGPKQGFDKAMENGDYIQFNSPQEADWFSKNYKKVWGE